MQWILLIALYLASAALSFLAFKIGNRYNECLLEDVDTLFILACLLIPFLNTINGIIGMWYALEWRREELGKKNHIAHWLLKLLS